MFKLSGDLIQAIVQLQEQEQVTDAPDPIASLDQAQPGWRDALPLPVADATVEVLLRNLVGQARTLTQTGNVSAGAGAASLSVRVQIGASHNS